MKRIDIISDTHGHLSAELLDALAGADLVIHAGDITSQEDWGLLCSRFRVEGARGNNDSGYDYGSRVAGLNRFSYEGLCFAVAHYREDLPVGEVDVAVCGHTHRPHVSRVGGCLIVNPGSPSYPRGVRGPTMARMVANAGQVISVKIIEL